jgi:hypothetical protein
MYFNITYILLENFSNTYFNIFLENFSSKDFDITYSWKTTSVARILTLHFPGKQLQEHVF